MVTVAFIRCFSCFSWFSYCRGNCICAGQGNTIVSHFVVQRGDFTVAIACVPCARAVLLSMREREDFGCAENCLRLRK